MIALGRLPGLILTVLIAATSPLAADKPRVLILGDDLYRPSAISVGKLLKDQVETTFVTASSDEAFNTGTALSRLDQWLGEGQWDLIYFNFGLSDLVYRAPGMTSFRVMSKDAGGVRAATPKDYEKSLRELIERLKATGAKLLWANTLPIGNSLLGIHEPGSEIEYNIIAAKIMTAEGVPIIDMHSYGLSLLTPQQAAGGVQPNHFQKQPLHIPMITAICRELKITKPPEASPSDGQRGS